MVYRGHIKDGVVVLDEPVKLPDGLQVRVELEEIEDEIHPMVKRMRGMLPQDIDAKDVYHESRRQG